MNLIDRAIAALSPSWGLSRAEARARLVVADTAIARAMPRKRFSDSWSRNDIRDRQSVTPGRVLSPIDRAKIRRLFKLNPFAKKMKANLLNNLIAYGITATPKGSKRLLKTWAEWIAYSDFDGVQDLYGQQELATWTMLQDGECFAVRRYIAGPVVPLRIQLLKVDQLDGTVQGDGIRDGIEYVDGKPAFYHFRRSVDPLFRSSGSERVPAADVIHLFRREEPGQWRGYSHFEAVIDALDDVDDYLEAEGVRKKIESCFAAFVERSPDADPPDRPMGDVDREAGADGPRIEALYPGMINYLDQGEVVKFGEPKAAGGFAEYLKWGALRIAAGGEVTYEGLTGDLSNVNFSSYRAGANEFETGMGRIQWLTIIPQYCARIVQWWLEAAYETGRIGPRDQRSEFKHTPPRVKTIDRKGDAQAALLEMEAGIESRRNLIAERGQDHDQLMDEIQQDRNANDRRGIAFKGDPMKAGAKNATGADAGSGAAGDGADDVSGSGDAADIV